MPRAPTKQKGLCAPVGRAPAPGRGAAMRPLPPHPPPPASPPTGPRPGHGQARPDKLPPADQALPADRSQPTVTQPTAAQPGEHTPARLPAFGPRPGKPPADWALPAMGRPRGHEALPDLTLPDVTPPHGGGPYGRDSGEQSWPMFAGLGPLGALPSAPRLVRRFPPMGLAGWGLAAAAANPDPADTA